MEAFLHTGQPGINNDNTKESRGYGKQLIVKNIILLSWYMLFIHKNRQ